MIARQHIGGLSSGLIGLGPLLMVFASAELGPSQINRFWLSALGCLAISLAGFMLGRLPTLSRAAGISGITLLLAVLTREVADSPTMALLWMIGSVVVLGTLFGFSSIQSLFSRNGERSSRPRMSPRLCAWFALATWLSAVITSSRNFHSSRIWIVVAVSIAFCFILAAKWVLSERRSHRAYLAWLAISFLALTGSAISALVTGTIPAMLWALFPASVLFLATERAEDVVESTGELLLEHPARLLVLGFFALSLFGSIVLALPIASATPTPIAFVDALFTSVSAVCVTGLTVLDVPNALSFFGQLWVLLLIQVGGLGIMTFYTAAFALFRRRFSVKHELAMLEMVGRERRGEVISAIRTVLKVTFASELIGAILLTFFFIQAGDAIPTAIWRGTFTAISAFCNAGFALQTANLIPYNQDHGVLHTVAILIVIGGLSPAAVVALPDFFRRKNLSVQIRVLVWTSVALLLLGTLAFLAFEWSNSLAGMPVAQKFSNAWFQSVTTRTAGFNSLEFAAFHPATIALILVLMFIGGSPGGTAGGIKVTTFALLLMATLGVFRGSSRVNLLGRHISHTSIYRSVAVVTVSTVVGGLVFVSLLVTQQIGASSLLFETVSALGTVGLSLGATAELDPIGKIIIMVCMLFGRVGPLTVLLALTSPRPETTVWLPKEELTVG